MESSAGFFGRISERIAQSIDEIWLQIPTFLILTLAAIIPIYTGAHASLSRPSSAAKPKKKGRSKRHNTQTDKRMEGLTPIDALLYPLGTGAMLTGLYYLIKWLQDPAILNKILNYYLTAFGTISIWQFVRDLSMVGSSFIFPARYSSQSKVWKIDSSGRRFVSSDHSEATNLDVHLSALPGRLSQLPLPSKVSRLIWKLWRIQTQPYALIEVFVKDLGSGTTVVNASSVLATTIALSTVIYYNLVDRPWWLTNLFGFSFCYSTLQLLSPTTFWTGTLILTSLFFYDIYFVFYTPMMIEVATKLDIPVKLLIPKSLDGSQPSGKQALTLLGLGDIVLPGIMLGLALRFDLYMHYLGKQRRSGSDVGLDPTNTSSSLRSSVTTKVEYIAATGNWGERFWLDSEALKHEGGSFPKPYFTAGMTGYVIGMLVTQMVMYVARHGQPALLYLVPSVLGSLWITAAARGEVPQMWAYTEAEDEETGKKRSDTGSKRPCQSDGMLVEGENLSTPEQVDTAHTSGTRNVISEETTDSDKSKNNNQEESKDKDTFVDTRKLFYVSISLPDESEQEAKPASESDKKE